MNNLQLPLFERSEDLWARMKETPPGRPVPSAFESSVHRRSRGLKPVRLRELPAQSIAAESTLDFYFGRADKTSERSSVTM